MISVLFGQDHLSLVVGVVVALGDQLGDRDDGVALVLYHLNDLRERFGRIGRAVVHQDDRAGGELAFDAADHLVGGGILPVEAVDVPLHAVHIA